MDMADVARFQVFMTENVRTDVSDPDAEIDRLVEECTRAGFTYDRPIIAARFHQLRIRRGKPLPPDLPMEEESQPCISEEDIHLLARQSAELARAATAMQQLVGDHGRLTRALATEEARTAQLRGEVNILTESEEELIGECGALRSACDELVAVKSSLEREVATLKSDAMERAAVLRKCIEERDQAIAANEKAKAACNELSAAREKALVDAAALRVALGKLSEEHQQLTIAKANVEKTLAERTAEQSALDIENRRLHGSMQRMEAVNEGLRSENQPRWPRA